MHACPAKHSLLQHRPKHRQGIGAAGHRRAWRAALRGSLPSPCHPLICQLLPLPSSSIQLHAHCSLHHCKPNPTQPSPLPTLASRCSPLGPAPASCTSSLLAVFGVKLHGAGAAAA